ncbi:hypothetical protein [Oerskovia flava]|uniref:hypothetical protein n=1 Tax=Oerskovia flava TaxID=2986422 RepID=UPI002240BAC6|nr:hypothetical protein [Oerskovia sp. JB1-3-2]
MEELSPEVESLDFLKPVISDLRHLLVTEQARLDTKVLEMAKRLSNLSIWATPATATDLSTIPLHSFAGSAHRNWASLKTSPTLRELYLEHGNFSWTEGLERLSKVTLTGMKGDVKIPRPSPVLNSVRELSLHGPRSLSLESLPDYQRLESLELSRIGEVLHASNVALLPNLKKLRLEDVRSMEESQWLRSDLPIEEVLIIGDTSWIAAAWTQLQPPPRKWSIPPWVK